MESLVSGARQFLGNKMMIRLIIVLVLFSSCRQAEQKNKETKVEKEDVVSGKNLFQQHCSACHITPGKNTRDEGMFGKIFERLPEPSESYFTKYIRDSKKLKNSGDKYARLLDEEYPSDYEHFFNELTESETQELIIFIKTSSQ